MGIHHNRGNSDAGTLDAGDTDVAASPKDQPPSAMSATLADDSGDFAWRSQIGSNAATAAEARGEVRTVAQPLSLGNSTEHLDPRERTTNPTYSNCNLFP